MVNARGECPTCVRVVCKHTHTMAPVVAVTWHCNWSGYRPVSRRGWKPCPWCGHRGEFKVKPVFHRLGTLCTHRKYARGEGPL